MTADTLIYARGGGHGHAMRGAVVQRMLRARGERTVLMVTPESARYLGNEDVTFETALPRARTIIVDTFPRGWQRELDDSTLALFDRRVLVARYNRDPRFTAEAASYDSVLSPYPVTLDEWPTLRRAQHTGWLVRSAPTSIEPGDDFVVLDPGQRLPRPLLDRLADYARTLGMTLVHMLRAPAHFTARKVLSIGAGYNTVYELATTRADLRFYPLARRFDDQAHRARTVGRSCATLQAVIEWLRAPVRTEPFAQHHASSLDAI